MPENEKHEAKRKEEKEVVLDYKLFERSQKELNNFAEYRHLTKVARELHMSI